MAMQNEGLPHDTESSAVPEATGSGWSKCSVAGPPGAEVVVEDDGTDVDGFGIRWGAAAPFPEPQPASTATGTSAAQHSGGNQDGGRTSDHLCRPKALGSGPNVPQRLCLEGYMVR
jgi:hypothetical protein